MSEAPAQSENEPPAETETKQPMQFSIRTLVFLTTAVAGFLAVGTQLSIALACGCLCILLIIISIWKRNLWPILILIPTVVVTGFFSYNEINTLFREAEARKAKAAFLTLIRQDRTLFVGNPDPDELEKFPLKKNGSHKFFLGGLEIDVRARTYSIVVEHVSGSSIWFYDGTFDVKSDGTWTASKPSVQHASNY